MKIRPVGAELFHADRRTDMTKLAVAFGNFVNAPKNAAFQKYIPFPPSVESIQKDSFLGGS
jgi:hypothetical protein